MEKRGISTLLATVLLIGFVIVIAIIALLWGRGIVKEEIEKTTPFVKGRLICQTNIDIDIKEAKCVPGQDTLNIRIANKKNIYINGFTFKVIGKDGTYTTSEYVPLNPYGEDIIAPKYEPSKTGIVDSVEIMPILLVENSMVTCSENPVTTKLDNC